MENKEDDINRLARRIAEENDRLARERREEYYRERNRPIQFNEWPRWFIWLPIILLVLVIIGQIYIANKPFHP